MSTSENEKMFINQDFDKFRQLTTTKSLELVGFGHTLYLNTGIDFLHMGMSIRHIKSPEIDALLIDLKMESITTDDNSMSGDWMFLRNGNLTFVVDNENIVLKCHDSDSNTNPMLGHGIQEIVYYDLTKEILDKFCSANSLSIRISGSKNYIDFDDHDCNRIKTMFQQFYNNLYDKNKYLESLTMDITPPKQKGCFIATAAMGDYDHPVVVDLRFFRDNWLLKRDWGVKFTSWYYEKGPIAANLIEKSTLLKKLTFILIVKPLQVLTNKYFK